MALKLNCVRSSVTGNCGMTGLQSMGIVEDTSSRADEAHPWAPRTIHHFITDPKEIQEFVDSDEFQKQIVAAMGTASIAVVSCRIVSVSKNEWTEALNSSSYSVIKAMAASTRGTFISTPPTVNSTHGEGDSIILAGFYIPEQRSKSMLTSDYISRVSTNVGGFEVNSSPNALRNTNALYTTKLPELLKFIIKDFPCIQSQASKNSSSLNSDNLSQTAPNLGENSAPSVVEVAPKKKRLASKLQEEISSTSATGRVAVRKVTLTKEAAPKVKVVRPRRKIAVTPAS